MQEDDQKVEVLNPSTEVFELRILMNSVYEIILDIIEKQDVNSCKWVNQMIEEFTKISIENRNSSQFLSNIYNIFVEYKAKLEPNLNCLNLINKLKEIQSIGDEIQDSEIVFNQIQKKFTKLLYFSKILNQSLKQTNNQKITQTINDEKTVQTNGIIVIGQKGVGKSTVIEILLDIKQFQRVKFLNQYRYKCANQQQIKEKVLTLGERSYKFFEYTTNEDDYQKQIFQQQEFIKFCGQHKQLIILLVIDGSNREINQIYNTFDTLGTLFNKKELQQNHQKFLALIFTKCEIQYRDYLLNYWNDLYEDSFDYEYKSYKEMLENQKQSIELIDAYHNDNCQFLIQFQNNLYQILNNIIMNQNKEQYQVQCQQKIYMNHHIRRFFTSMADDLSQLLKIIMEIYLIQIFEFLYDNLTLPEKEGIQIEISSYCGKFEDFKKLFSEFQNFIDNQNLLDQDQKLSKKLIEYLQKLTEDFDSTSQFYDISLINFSLDFSNFYGQYQELRALGKQNHWNKYGLTSFPALIDIVAWSGIVVAALSRIAPSIALNNIALGSIALSSIACTYIVGRFCYFEKKQQKTIKFKEYMKKYYPMK
ncbi:unnamed protein product [Paramecium sonneborni]|uniref:Uncharacterized protein n=1 Tax=Paramecium sonneborni TaxID=65129 RepID=A0A8S1RBH1_9CILI|nr:unnamed protein product [Paramecium sonneborni]